ncbi:hypothetical protein V2I01_34475 [Micromonospora sp. BRA006-A]|nr:hypothetical protein [Micromonospora sp. BRA006-A]
MHRVEAEQRLGLRSRTASASRRTGSFTPVLECTQVSATTRVRGVSAAVSPATISSSVAVAASR